jgi:hypothetical protein
MLILFDHGTPRGLILALSGHTVITAQSKGWDRLSNGALLNAAEEEGIDLLSTDQGIRYQQNLAGRKIALVVLTGATKWSRVRLHSRCGAGPRVLNLPWPRSSA